MSIGETEGFDVLRQHLARKCLEGAAELVEKLLDRIHRMIGDDELTARDAKHLAIALGILMDKVHVLQDGVHEVRG